MTLLTLRNLCISARSVPLVKHVLLEVNKGEILALVGESGSGKTLTALSILKLLPPGLRQSGEMTFEGGRWSINSSPRRGGAGRGAVTGKDGATPSPHPNPPTTGEGIERLRGSRIGMIFQEPMTSLNPLHTIGKQVAESVEIHHSEMKKPAIRARVIDLLEKVGLAGFKDRLNAYPHQLSGGERQRVMIAMAIANDPALLIADEPTTALDVTIQAQILKLIDELRARLDMAVLLITHDLPLVRRIADRIAIMSKGELVEKGKTAEIFAAPRHPYTKHLLASEPGKAPAPALRDAKELLSVSNLSIAFAQSGFLSLKRAEKQVLENVSFTVPEGSTLGVVGESGSGKTSLALALLRLIPSRGEIFFKEGNEKIRLDTLSGSALRKIRSRMQMVFQDPFSSLNPRMTVGMIVREGLNLHAPAMPEAEKVMRLAAILHEVGLEPSAADRYPHEFSGGQRQRISIARALILKPRLLILDEPTSALDLSVQAQILELLKSLQVKHGLTYIFISHDLRVIRAISHRILVLEKGRMVEQGEARQILESPGEDYTKALLKAAML